MKKKVILGMSGGIDSSIAAIKLQELGYEVIGVTMKLWAKGSRCCDIKDIMSAQKLAQKLGIKHFVLDLTKEFKEFVVDYFADEYKIGKTPNPCVMCNQYIKFPFLFDKLSKFGIDYIATGHYASIKKIEDEYFLATAKDLSKTQEYFMASIDKSYLPNIIFPMANYIKKNVKKELNKIDMDFRNDESQEVCFIDENDTYFNFIEEYYIDNEDYSGFIVDPEGNRVREVENFMQYTIGQRRGLGVSGPVPYYVNRIDAKNREIHIGGKELLDEKSFFINNVKLFSEKFGDSFSCGVKIRYRSPQFDCTVKMLSDSRAKVMLLDYTQGITPGQFAVFYKNDYVMGSGWIE